MVQSTGKNCRMCGQYKSLEEFYGHHSECKICSKTYNKTCYRLKHPYLKSYYQAKNLWEAIERARPINR